MKWSMVILKNAVIASVLSAGIVAAVIPSRAFAADEAARSRHRFGVFASIFGDPFPTLVGANLGVNVLSFVRLTAGYGTMSATTSTGPMSATTLGGGIHLLVPGWNFSPIAGISYANVSITGTGATVGGFGASGSHYYVSGGFDWQTGYGLNLGVGYNYSLMAGVGGLPYFNIGWYF